MAKIDLKNINVAEVIKEYSKKAKNILDDDEKTEKFLQKIEKKLEDFPAGGDKLKYLPIMVSLVRFYVKKEYRDIPLKSILAIVGALIYFVKPVDIIPDWLGILGFSDDALIIAGCFKLVENDVKKFEQWRKDNNKVYES